MSAAGPNMEMLANMQYALHYKLSLTVFLTNIFAFWKALKKLTALNYPFRTILVLITKEWEDYKARRLQQGNKEMRFTLKRISSCHVAHATGAHATPLVWE